MCFSIVAKKSERAKTFCGVCENQLPLCLPCFKNTHENKYSFQCNEQHLLIYMFMLCLRHLHSFNSVHIQKYLFLFIR